MAAAVPVPPTPPEEVTAPAADVNRLCGLVREIRAEAQNLQTSLDGLKEKNALTDPLARPIVFAAFEDNRALFDYNRAQIEGRFRQLRGVLDRNSEILDHFGDHITDMENQWQRVVADWPDAKQKLDEVLLRLTRANEHLDRLVYAAGLLTIPRRLNEHLAQLAVGQSLDFHDAFLDEMPKPEHRARLLNFIERHPKLINGVVDAAHGQVYRAAEGARRYASFWLMAAAPADAGVTGVCLYPSSRLVSGRGSARHARPVPQPAGRLRRNRSG